MRIATWNIAGGRQYIGRRPEADQYGYDRENLSYFTQELGSVRPDVAMLQEVHLHKKTASAQSEGFAQALHLKSTPPFPYDNSHIDKNHKLSLATLCTTPMEGVSFYALPEVNLSIVRPNGERWVSFSPTGFLVSEIEYGGQKVNMVNVHLHPFHYYDREFGEPEFQEYRSAISQFFLRMKDMPTIVAGDFNYADLKKVVPEIFEEGGYSDAFLQQTTPEKGQQDHIIFSKHWRLEQVQVKRGFADHYLCWADLSLVQEAD